MAKSNAKSTAAPVIDPEQLYKVAVSRSVPIAGVTLGPLADIRLRGDILSGLLAGEHADAIASYEPVAD